LGRNQATKAVTSLALHAPLLLLLLPKVQQ
jgi:hypothetical protein